MSVGTIGGARRHLVERVGFEPTLRHNRKPDFESTARTAHIGDLPRAGRLKHRFQRQVRQNYPHKEPPHDRPP